MYNETMNLDNGRRLAVTVTEMAKLLGISRTSAYQLVSNKGFPVFTIGKQKMVSVDGLKQWIEEQCRRGNSL